MILSLGFKLADNKMSKFLSLYINLIIMLVFQKHTLVFCTSGYVQRDFSPKSETFNQLTYNIISCIALNCLTSISRSSNLKKVVIKLCSTK